MLMIKGDEMKELDVVKLKDGRTGTILYFYDSGKTAMIEIADKDGKTIEQPFIPVDEIVSVIYSA